MNNTRYTIYWLDSDTDFPCVHRESDLVLALQFMEKLRKKPQFYGSIAMCSENMDSVGKSGVDSVKDGKTPDGVEYSWVKRRDGGQ
jgi:hypothetical protein